MTRRVRAEVKLPVERVGVREHGVNVRLRDGLSGLVQEVEDGSVKRGPHPPDVRKRGGRKLVVTPDRAPRASRPRVDNAMVKALARAFRWRKMLDESVHATPCYAAAAKTRPSP